MVQHENNEAAFFAKQVVLVEGDSDTFTYPHLAKLLNTAWDAIDHNIMFVKIDGKGNIARYRKFFEIFEIPIHVITDLDALARGFNQLTDTPHIKVAHSKMMDSIGQQVPKPNNPNSEKVKNICGKRKPRELWHDAQNHLASFRSEPTAEIAESLEKTLAELFKAGDGDATMELLADQQPSSISSMRNEVISALANEKVYVLQRGDLEDYCGTHVGKDKVATAIEFCDRTTSVEHLKTIHGDDSESVIEELRSIFTHIFGNPVLHPGVEEVIRS
ncbi:ATP-dependent endonuclease [Glutamicibacter protophormiae]|uniref:ATP-dependent endonuclease n=1 Tax=Glutamicibacter protophormiae TaxID=37930 RepID=UPI00195B0135|nr:ATP-dependent endonuclease [Glutamicibacter protophormiae]QRQ79328.1 ATP-dependent endonuclease [Glutamicibacter protophormiae]